MRKLIATASLSIWSFVDLPLCGCVEATPDQPHLGFKLKLDPAQLCEIIAQTNQTWAKRISESWFISDAAHP